MQNKAKIMEIAAGKKAKIAGKYEVRNNAKQRYCKEGILWLGKSKTMQKMGSPRQKSNDKDDVHFLRLILHRA